MGGDDEQHGDTPSFAELVGKVRRLEHDTVEPEPRRRAPRRPAREQPAAHAMPADDWSDHGADDDGAEDYHRAGVQHGILRRLRRGHYPVEDEVDLHGMTLAEARVALAHFLEHARRPRLCCVRVIHGKGLSSPGFRAVLKPRVRHWLRQDARVLAFIPAPAHDGGSGALYVLLRSRG